MLMVIAPYVPGHHGPVVTSGDGGPISSYGIYCVGFDGTCKANANQFPKPGSGSGTYDTLKVLPVKAYGSGLSWSTIQSNSIAFLLPIARRHTAWRQGRSTNYNAFRLLTNPANEGISDRGPAHHNNGPASFGLFTCASSAPPTTSCPTSAIQGTLDNSGTLRITMKAEEHTDAQDPCDYHARMAYHSMLMFLDPTPLQQHPTGERTNVNQSIGYMEHANTSDLGKCLSGVRSAA